MALQPETVRSRYTDEDAAFLEPLGFEGTLGRTSFMERKRMASGRFTTSNPRRYIQWIGRGWFATVTNGQGAMSWRSPPFPDPITCYVHAELVQWQK